MASIHGWLFLPVRTHMYCQFVVSHSHQCGQTLERILPKCRVLKTTVIPTERKRLKRVRRLEPTAMNTVLIARALGVSVEYLVTGKETAIPQSIRPEVIDIICDINHLSDSDLHFTKEMVKRLRIPIKKV